MVIDLRAKVFSPESKAPSRNDLLIQKSLVEQSLNEARKLLVSWSVEASKRKVDSQLYFNRMRELWYSGKWDESHYKNLENRLREAFYNKGTYTARVEILEDKLNRIKTQLGL